MKLVVGLFETSLDADRVISQVCGQGQDCTVISGERFVMGPERREGAQAMEQDAGGEQVSYPAIVGPGLLPLAGENVALAGSGLESAGTKAEDPEGQLIASLVEIGIPEEQARFYARGLRHGATLVAVRVPAKREPEVLALMRHSQGTFAEQPGDSGT